MWQTIAVYVGAFFASLFYIYFAAHIASTGWHRAKSEFERADSLRDDDLGMRQ